MNNDKKYLMVFKYDGEYFDVYFDENDQIKEVWMYTSPGFKIDLLDVTHLMSDWFNAKAREQYSNIKGQINEDRIYESWRDNKAENEDDDDGPNAA